MSAVEAPPPFLFVVGCGRSGTSVLGRVLDGHSALAVAHEAGFVYPLSRRRTRYERPGSFDVEALTSDLLEANSVRQNLGFDADDLREALCAAPISDYADAVRRVFARFAALKGKSRYGDKMPAYVQHMSVLAELFPEARFVHIIRDGRDVALSAMAIDGERHDPVARGIEWRQRVQAGCASGRHLGPLRYQEVRYEQLVSDPEPPIASLCRFLGLEYEPAMLELAERPDTMPDKLRANPRHARLGEPLSKGRRSWQSHMTRDELERFEAVAGGLLEELGYERGAPDPSLTARGAAAWGELLWQLKRARARLPGMARRALAR